MAQRKGVIENHSTFLQKQMVGGGVMMLMMQARLRRFPSPSPAGSAEFPGLARRGRSCIPFSGECSLRSDLGDRRSM